MFVTNHNTEYNYDKLRLSCENLAEKFTSIPKAPKHGFVWLMPYAIQLVLWGHDQRAI